jgi:hypothetical protein
MKRLELTEGVHYKTVIVEQGEARAWRRLKNASLAVCVFVVLCVVFGSVLKAGEAATFLGALCGTPLVIHAFNRIAPASSSTTQQTSIER